MHMAAKVDYLNRNGQLALRAIMSGLDTLAKSDEGQSTTFYAPHTLACAPRAIGRAT